LPFLRVYSVQNNKYENLNHCETYKRDLKNWGEIVSAPIYKQQCNEAGTNIASKKAISKTLFGFQLNVFSRRSEAQTR
jgi:hypothetical protein